MKTIARLSLALALCLPALAPAQTVDMSKSQLSFGFKQENVPGQGAFRKFTAQVAFDAAKPQATTASVEVDVTSVDFGNAGWNNDIQSEDWFDTRKYPKSSFVLSGGAKLVNGHYEAPAKFTLKGVTRNVTASFTAKPDAGGTLIEGSVPVKRNDYKVGAGSWADTTVVANEVVVRFKVYLKK
jgi:polyisoprenoid-binding protein YceI